MRSRRPIRLATFLTLALASLLAIAPAALGADGVGLGGRTDDKIVTYWGFGVIVFFTVLVTVLSLIQMRLETRKDRIRSELERLRPPVE